MINIYNYRQCPRPPLLNFLFHYATFDYFLFFFMLLRFSSQILRFAQNLSVS